MKKPVIALLALALCVAAGALAYAQWMSPTARMCAKIAEQCGAEILPVDGCRDSFASASASEIGEIERCVAPSASCLESLGCISGSAFRSFGEGFARGVAGP